MIRAALAALLCALAAAVASGCGTDTVDPATVAEAAEATSAAGGAKIELEGTVSARGQTVDISGTGEMDEKGRSAMEMELPGGAGTMRQVFAGYVLYQQLPGIEEQLGKEWMKIDLVRAYRQVGVTLDLLQQPGGQDPRQMLAQLRNASGAIEKLGTEEVQGAETTHYKGDIDLRKQVDRVPAARRDEARRSVEKLIDISGTEGYPMEVWIDDEKLVRRMRMKLSINNPAFGGKIGMDVTMEMSGYGSPVHIAVPPDEQVKDLTDTVARQLK
ncbi:MAG TPA: hypothetical protein VF712_11035 [Thermoleophilaceae bacterium]